MLVVLWCVLCAGGVGVAAWRLGPLFGVPLALAAAVAIDSFYIAPYRSFDSQDWVNYLVTAMYIAIGVFVGAILEVTRRRAATSETARSKLAEEQAALRRVATLIAQGGPPEEVFAAVAAEMRDLVGADRDADHSPRTRRYRDPRRRNRRRRPAAPARAGRARSRDRGGVADRADRSRSTTTAESLRSW